MPWCFLRFVGQPRRLICILILFLVSIVEVQADSGRVQVVDGDTVRVDKNRFIRLAGINAPEIAHRDSPGEPFGQESKQYLCSLIGAGPVRWNPLGKDRYGRVIAVVRSADGRDLNLAMVAAGWAYRLPTLESKSFGPSLLEVQKRAMTARAGMWKGLRRNAAGPFWGNTNSGRFHAARCPLARRMRKDHKRRFNSVSAAFEAGYAPARDCLSGRDLFSAPTK